jgi:hypothetical protein
MIGQVEHGVVGGARRVCAIFDNADAARARLRVIVPLTLVIIIGLLMLAFKSLSESILIMLSVPFAMVGGVFLQWILGYSMTTAVIVGYISLFAVAVQTGVLMVAFIREAIARKTDDQSYTDAVIDGVALSDSRSAPFGFAHATRVYWWRQANGRSTSSAPTSSTSWCRRSRSLPSRRWSRFLASSIRCRRNLSGVYRDYWMSPESV